MKNSASSLLRHALAAVLIFSVSLGAQSLSGRIIDPNGVPIPGIEVDPGSGSPTAVSDLLGQFTIFGLQSGSHDVEYLPSETAPWGAREVVTNVAGATNIGDVTLQPAFFVSGICRNSAGLPLLSCNLNFHDSQGVKLFTPHDNTDITGAFSVAVPTGTWKVTILPPVGALLVPRVFLDVVVAAPVDLGIVTLPTGYQVTGTVIDSVSNVPVGSTRVRARNALDGVSIRLPNDTASAFGAFSVVLPFGIIDLEFEPPVGNTHVGRQLFGAFILGPTNLGQVRLENGVALSGTVTGPLGAVEVADIDVLAADGSKIFTAHDLTSATGAFSVAVPAGGTYNVRVEPQASTGLVGHFSLPVVVNAPTNVGTITLAAGMQVTGTITGPQGVEANANLDFFDQNGVEVVTIGDHTDASGQFTTFVPAGTWCIEVDGAERSHGMPVSVPGVVIAGSTTWNRTLASKDIVAGVTGFGIPTLNQGGLLPANLFLQGLAVGSVPTQLELVVELPSGQELTVFPPIQLSVFPFALQLSGLWVPMPIVPNSARNKELEFVMRCRDPITNLVQDAASTKFVVR